MTTVNVLAIDLGADSGRTMLGTFDGERLRFEETHRFPNGPVRVGDHLHWDVLRLWGDIKNGITKTVQDHQLTQLSIGLDTWGVDFALLDDFGQLLCNPYHYRDPWTGDILDAAFEIVPRRELFMRTGVQFLQFNTLFQLLALRRENPLMLDAAATIFMMPSLFNYWLTGVKANERTIASTSQCLDPKTGTWSTELLEQFEIPDRFAKLLEPGTILGPLLPAVAEEIGIGEVQVVVPGCHDTASAVAAVPARDEKYAYLSSGTWSPLGVELAAPVINEATFNHNFTNEGGVEGKTRLLTNQTGLWLFQELQRTWALQGEALSYDQLTQLAEAAPAFSAVIDPNDSTFMAPGAMPERIRNYCVNTQQTAPESKGAIVRTALESLALNYRRALERLESILGYRLNVLHIVGGGSQNNLLNQWVADALNRRVIAGPVEATAIGNALMQLLSGGHIASLEEGRDLVRRSFETKVYEPQLTEAWDNAYGKFLELPNTAVS